MNTFFVVAAVMAAIAAGAVALPLLRDRQSRLVGALLAIAVIGASAALYPLWSNWNWHEPAQSASAAGPDVGAMVAKLEKHMQEQPSDLPGWLMLGRSYLTLNRLDDAIVAFDHAHQLDSKNVDAAMGLGEAMSLRAGGDITPQAAQLFEEALAFAPANPKALLYGGFAAAVRGDRPLARARWMALKNLNPPPQIMQMLDARIAELGPSAGSPSPGGTAGAAPAGTSASRQGTNTSPGDLSGADVAVNISIAPALKSRLVSEVPLFVFAREPGSRGPPLAVKRLSSTALGTQVHLSAADSMVPGRVLMSGQQVSITARVSFSGQPTASAGDLYGELSYDVGRDGVRNLVIDHVAQ
ncbi:MAG: cytochrome c-type biosis protein CcmH [Gammaproteobacteria bacterium]|jgi:cytochrome c-type biogenesis protein CcmH|nr:cytochrome c-type biosis protein CcmH [Gammaproteobacteria bacterium]